MNTQSQNDELLGRILTELPKMDAEKMREVIRALVSNLQDARLLIAEMSIAYDDETHERR